MKIFKKKNETQTSKKLINVNALKKGGYLAGVIAVVCVVVILLNVGFSLLDNRGYLKADMTAQKVNTISDDNKKLLKDIKQDVQITVLCTESDYTATLPYYLSEYGIAFDDLSYFEQTLSFLKRYEEINSKIDVKFINHTSSEAKVIFDEYTNAFIGDILVTSTDASGKKTSKLVTYDKIYQLTDETGYAAQGYGYYYITGNDLETALTSAINTVANGDDEVIGVINAHTTEQPLAFFANNYTSELEYNGFTTVQITDTVINKIPEDVTVLAIVMPQTDYLKEEIEVINKWLDNDGKRGHSVMFLPNTSMKNMPILKEFLEEWGVSYGDGLLYQTEETQHAADYPTFMYSYTEDNETVVDINDGASSLMISDNNLPITLTFEENGTRKTEVITSTSDGATVMPTDAAEDWKPAKNADTAIYPTMVVTSDSVTVDGKVLSSYVYALSSYEMVYNYGGDFGNLELSMSAARYISGTDTKAQKLFVTRQIETVTLEGKVTESAANRVRLIFMIIIPIVLVIIGFTVWILRRKR